MQEVQVLMESRLTKFVRPYPYEELRETFSFRPEGYEFMPSFRDGRWDGVIHKLRYDRIPTGLFRAMRIGIEKRLDVRFNVHDRTTRIHFNNKVYPDARPYQNDCVEAMKVSSQLGGGIVLAPTGVGKTRMSGMFLDQLEGTAVFIVDELTLLDQARREISQVIGASVGIVGRSEFQPERITVATVQTLGIHCRTDRFRVWMKNLKVAMIDEFHLMMNRRQTTVLDSFRPPVVLGLTATLNLDKTPVAFNAYCMAGPVVFRFDRESATKQGYLTGGTVFQVSAYNHVVERSAEFTADYSRMIVNGRIRNELVVELTKAALAKRRKVLVLVEWVQHLKKLEGLFRSEGLQFDVAHGSRSSSSRARSIKKFDSGKINLILANRVFQKGVDIKTVDCIIDATAGKSGTSCIQRYGRGVRLAEGKQALIYLDIADEGNRFSVYSKLRRKAFLKNRIRVFRVRQGSDDLRKLILKAEELSNEVNKKKTEIQEKGDATSKDIARAG